MNSRVVAQLRRRALDEVELGLEFGGIEGCTAALAYQGEVVWEEGFGAAANDTPIVLMSITKTVLEAALWVLFDRGLRPDTPIVDIIPEFMGNSEPRITISMLETHLGGFAWHPLEDAVVPSRKDRIAAFSAWRLEQPAGFYEYHPLNASWVLAEVIARASGHDYRDFLRREVLAPLGLARADGLRLGVLEEELSRVLLHRNYANGYTPHTALRQPMSCGIDTPSGLQAGIPGIGAVGTASAVAMLYQAYLNNTGELWNPVVLGEARDVIQVDMPDKSGRPMLRSRSFVLAGAERERYGERSFFGPLTSPRSFGHQGQGGQIAWADPATGVSFAFLTNTVVFPPGGTFHARSRHLSALAARAIPLKRSDR